MSANHTFASLFGFTWYISVLLYYCVLQFQFNLFDPSAIICKFCLATHSVRLLNSTISPPLFIHSQVGNRSSYMFTLKIVLFQLTGIWYGNELIDHLEYGDELSAIGNERSQPQSSPMCIIVEIRQMVIILNVCIFA